MNETAAHLVDNVIGNIPVRHWVCTVPPPLRYLLAYDTSLCSAVLDAFIRAISRWLRHKAKAELGLRSVEHAHPAAVTMIHRASSHLALNIHFHTIASDGVYPILTTFSQTNYDIKVLPGAVGTTTRQRARIRSAIS